MTNREHALYASIEGSVGGAVVVVTFSFKRHHLMQALT
jgi:hypothetical protein